MIGIIGSETTKNYGLLEDLEPLNTIQLYYTEPPRLKGTLAWSLLHRILPSTMENIRITMPWENTVLDMIDKFDRIVVIDTALRWLELDFLLKCRERKPNLIIECMLLNSISSMAFSENKIRTKFYLFDWNGVLTFDPGDAEKYSWKYIGLHYYSKLELGVLEDVKSDAFFAGSLAGSRGEEIKKILIYMNEHDVKCDFLCPRLSWKQKFDVFPEGLKLLRRRIPYKAMLQNMTTSNCIIEILQEGQNGSSLRYFEAVCYNKKLLTTNSQIVNYPFFDERYMKVFKKISDIDCEWVKTKENINYGYTDEFSPKKIFIENE